MPDHGRIGTYIADPQHGLCWYCRQVVSTDSGTVSLSANARVSGPLKLEAVNPSEQIPLSGGSPATLLFSSWHPPSWNEPDCTAGAEQLASLEPAGLHGDANQILALSDVPTPKTSHKESASTKCTFQLQDEAISLENPSMPQPVHLSLEWRQAATVIAEAVHTELTPAPVVAVVGSKQVGKSSFSRLLINSLLDRHAAVAYLDTDCGQAEFSAPGGNPAPYWTSHN